MINKLKEIEKKINDLDKQIILIGKKDYHCVVTSKQECIELLTENLNNFKDRFKQPNSELLLNILLNDVSLEIEKNKILRQ